ncbi:hypothetical protein DSUL_100078 [Desulfovibrionales bacterium]
MRDGILLKLAAFTHETAKYKNVCTAAITKKTEFLMPDESQLILNQDI